jgi:general secretion pathway protein G
MRNASRRRRNGEDGYTLTEILVVMAIIGLIAALVTPGLIDQLGRARVKTAQVQVQSVAAAVEVFRSDVGRYPTQSEGLTALITEPGGVDGWTGPYLKANSMLTDPWGHQLVYNMSADGLSYTVTSYGADGKQDGVGFNKDIQAPAAH